MLRVMFLLLIAVSLSAAEAPVDTVTWTHEAIGTVSFSQNSFSNWAQGGTNQLSWFADGNGKLIRENSGSTWQSNLKMELGQVKQDGVGTRKSLDQIFMESIYTLKKGDFFNPYVAASLKTQFVTGYDYDTEPDTEVSAFNDPLVMTQSVGGGMKPYSWLESRVGLAAKETFTDQFTSWADDSSTSEIEKSRVEGGIEIINSADIKVNGHVSVKSRLALFWGFENTDKMDVDWATDVNVNLYKMINLTFKLQLIYDEDVIAKTQLMQVFGVGMSYSL
ncbi:MAG: DUF3078 domain-containing protein [bacterium]|nr:DUF3078 domain-containing protein [bacterium]MCP4798893.1 DUF3078 domain-containing protein [bacterium]